MSQELLAIDAGIERSYMSRIERGLENPSVAILERIQFSTRCTHRHKTDNQNTYRKKDVFHIELLFHILAHAFYETYSPRNE